MTFDPMQLPRVVEWAAPFHDGSLSVADYVGEVVGPTGAVVVARFFWPAFIRVDDCVLLADRYDDVAFKEWKETGASRSTIEAAVNHVHLWDVFASADDVVPEEAMTFLAEVLARTWAAALAAAFPGEDMVVEVSESQPEYGPTVTVRSRG